jgi:hypothetical protein
VATAGQDAVGALGLRRLAACDAFAQGTHDLAVAGGGVLGAEGRFLAAPPPRAGTPPSTRHLTWLASVSAVWV